MSDMAVSINDISPVLRMIFRQGENSAMIRYNPASSDQNNCLTIELPLQKDCEIIINTIKKAVGQKTSDIKAIFIKGVGRFDVLPLSAGLSGKVSGKVAVVTGAAQGFGLEIAEDLLSQGAFVFLADINKQQAQIQADTLCRSYGAGRAFALGVNVADGQSVRQGFDEVVKLFGGFDILISNAGVLKAGSVKTQTEKDFDFVTAVNYKGYYLCTQAAAKILALQHKTDSSYVSDIIQINSKSGLVGSNMNFAYAGSKFGGIGLTQSFALELVGDGIKVNSICPGNFFDGPLWSDPQNGLFVQYLRTGKVPGAKNIQDVRKAYEDKVPMKRGCTTADVMKAIYYLIEQKYETGQAVPVTGGQIMLH